MPEATTSPPPEEGTVEDVLGWSPVEDEVPLVDPVAVSPGA